MCAASPAWRKIAVREFEKSIALGADGILYDENQHHGPGRYCFSQTHGHRHPAFNFSGDIPLARMFHSIIREQNPDFLLAGEGSFDQQLNQYGVSYVRIGPGPRTSASLHLSRCTNHDRCLRLQRSPPREPGIDVPVYIELRTEKLQRTTVGIPANFGVRQTRRLTPTSVRRVALGRGNFATTQGAAVTVDGEPYAHYSVYVDQETGRRAVVVINPAADESVSVVLRFA